jgi:AraC-like DNA-binding protein
MNATILFGTFITVFYVLLLIIKREKSLPDLFLGIIFLFYGLNIGLTWVELYNADHGYPYPRFMNISWVFLLLHGPAMWFYIKSHAFQPFRFKWFWLFHLVPFIVFSIAQYFDFLSLPAAERIRIVSEETFKENALYKLSVIAIAVSTITYNLWGLKLIKEHRLNLKLHFSHIADKDLRWLEVLIIANLVIYGINVSLFNLDLVFDFASYRLMMQLAYTFATIYTLVLGYYGIRQGNVFVAHELPLATGDGKSRDPKKNVAAAKTLIPGTKEEAHINRLLTDMETKKPFLDPDITVSKLAEMHQVTPAYLSRILNDHLDQTFFDFINRYRIEEFKTAAMAEHASRLSIMGLAYECGFNSKAAFYRAFRRYENCSPTEYLARLRKK